MEAHRGVLPAPGPGPLAQDLCEEERIRHTIQGGHPALPPWMVRLPACEAWAASLGPWPSLSLRLFSGYMRRPLSPAKVTFTRTSLLHRGFTEGYPLAIRSFVSFARARARARARESVTFPMVPSAPGPTLALRPWRSTKLEPRASSRGTSRGTPWWYMVLCTMYHQGVPGRLQGGIYTTWAPGY